MKNNMGNKRLSQVRSALPRLSQNKAQTTVFIIIAILVVAAVVLYVTLKSDISIGEVSPSIQPIYTSFLSCLEEDALLGIDVLESQGGYIEVPEFEPGSRYMPFSSQLDFLGNPIPYWYYVSGNNIQKEQVPSREGMEEQLGEFVGNRVSGCDFESYYEEGFEIEFDPEDFEADVSIRENEVEISLDMGMSVVKGDDSAVVRNHKVVVSSKLGILYDDARKVYEKEQEDLFLENYSIDILRNYAPVDGVELSCSPVIWNADEVFDELEDAIEINTLALKSKGPSNDYFVVDLPVSASSDVRFINSKQWPSGFEINPSEGPVMIVSPVGNQPGIGIMGFCYVPYHFVYNMRYPVLVQIQQGEETFQFPLAVVIQGNNPREALDISAIDLELPEICEYKNSLTTVNVYDSSVRPVDANIFYECFGTSCNIGETSSGSLTSEFPQCANGFVIAKAKGFETSRKLYSTTSEGSVEIFMEELYGMEIDLNLDGKDYTGEAIVSFVSSDSGKGSRTIVYPEQKTVELSEGQYEIQVQIYRSSNLKIDATSIRQCVDIPRSGLGGLIGLTKEDCFDVAIPSQDIENALSGGGKENYYILGDELENSNIIEINAPSLPVPKTLEQLQDNYLLFEGKGLDITFN